MLVMSLKEMGDAKLEPRILTGWEILKKEDETQNIKDKTVK
jgi:hypothetical protein